MSLKVYIHLELDEFPHHTSKIQIPKSWSEKSVKDVIGLFLGAYNKKFPDNAVDVDDVHLNNTEGTKIFSDSVVSEVLEDHFDYYIKFGKHLKKPIVEDNVDQSTMLRCKNYGCNQYYKEEENHETSCRHHTAPPIFHDTMKCWSCCRDRKAYDFEEFQKIQGCSVGFHSQVLQKVVIADSPNKVEAPVQLKSIADYNTTNPQGPTAAATAAKLNVRASTRSEDGLSARCRRKGCQKNFLVKENHPEACVHHKGQPIFHDAIKFWSCCPDIKCYDFEEFLAVKGCGLGFHDDGVIDLPDVE